MLNGKYILRKKARNGYYSPRYSYSPYSSLFDIHVNSECFSNIIKVTQYNAGMCICTHASEMTLWYFEDCSRILLTSKKVQHRSFKNHDSKTITYYRPDRRKSEGTIYDKLCKSLNLWKRYGARGVRIFWWHATLVTYYIAW